MDVSKLTPDDMIVDLSSFNAVTSYAAMRVENGAGWSKATQGAGYRNPLFATQAIGMLSVGMRVGAYHFPDPNVSVPANVSKFLSVAGDWVKAGCLAPLLDVENDLLNGIVWNVNNANTFVPGFIAELRRQSGISDLGVVVYGSDSWWNATLRPDVWGDLSHVFLMVADYNGDPGNTTFKHKRLAVHQYTDKAPTPGVAKPTDRSVIMRDNGFSLNDLIIGNKPIVQEEDDDMAVKPVLFQAEGYGHGVWRDEFGNYVGFASENEKKNMIAAWGSDVRLGPDNGGVWVEKLTLDELVRLSRSEEVKPAADVKES
jgi:GH25 family lysozyme M1 (1,4-beta-N-acetylmuramidase)